MNYYTSDLHFGHQKIISLCNRPFDTVEEMNQTIINNINSRCKDSDMLYILGDIGFCGNYVVDLVRQINCKKILIVGNHDHKQIIHRSFRSCFEDIKEYAYVRDGEYKIYCAHYPHAEWDGWYKNWYHFFGHVHNADTIGARIMRIHERAVNVGIDVNSYIPKTAKELITQKALDFVVPDLSVREFLKFEKDSVMQKIEEKYCEKST